MMAEERALSELADAMRDEWGDDLIDEDGIDQTDNIIDALRNVLNGGKTFPIEHLWTLMTIDEMDGYFDYLAEDDE